MEIISSFRSFNCHSSQGFLKQILWRVPVPKPTSRCPLFFVHYYSWMAWDIASFYVSPLTPVFQMSYHTVNCISAGITTEAKILHKKEQISFSNTLTTNTGTTSMWEFRRMDGSLGFLPSQLIRNTGLSGLHCIFNNTFSMSKEQSKITFYETDTTQIYFLCWKWQIIAFSTQNSNINHDLFLFFFKEKHFKQTKNHQRHSANIWEQQQLS